MGQSSGRGWAYTSLILMGGLSIAGNIAHTYMVRADPDVLDIILASGWPVGLFLAIEMFARLPWHLTRYTVAARWVRYGGLLLAGLLTGIVSYEHLHNLLAARSQGFVVSLIGPLAIDGIMAMATMGLVLTATRATHIEPEHTDVTAEIERLERLFAEQQASDAEIEREMSEIESLPEAPVSPAPAGERKPRASRTSYDWRQVAERAMNGEPAKDIHKSVGVGLSTAGRYTRVAGMLREDARALVDPAREHVREDHIAFMRQLARVAR